MGTGNTTGRGGTTGTGNVTGRGGTTGTGNTTGAAGVSGTGNTTGAAGVSGTGNTTGQAGVSGTGNTTGAAGVSGSAGSTGTCPPSFQVSTRRLRTDACERGRLLARLRVHLHRDSELRQHDYAQGLRGLRTPCTLSSTGMISTATATNSYCAVVGMGFSINQPAGATTPATLAPKGQGIKVTFSETRRNVSFRVQLRDDSTSTATVTR